MMTEPGWPQMGRGHVNAIKRRAVGGLGEVPECPADNQRRCAERSCERIDAAATCSLSGGPAQYSEIAAPEHP